jgi:cobalamin biosynthesis protein CobT
MEINLDRLCKLAGLESTTQTLNEASNSSMRDDPALAGEAEYRYGSGQLAEGDGDADDKRGQDAENEVMDPTMEGDTHEEPRESMHTGMSGHSMEEMEIMPPSAEEGMMGHGHMGMEEDAHEGMGHSDAMEEMDEMGPMDEMDEMIEVDEAMLVQEIRRARVMLAEAARQSQATPEQLAEQQLKKIVAEEVENVMKDLNLTAGWVYGDKKPTNSRRGAVNTAFPGIGFKNSK